MFVLLVSGSFYDKMKHFSEYGYIRGSLGEMRFSTFHDKIYASCYKEKSVEIEEAEVF
jgi:hypothetical protein